MNATERVSQKFHDHTEDSINNQDLYLAWLDFHRQKPGAHPDDYLDSEGPYQGWHVLMARKMFEKKNMNDGVMYPTFVLKLNWLLEQLDEFHSSDDDGTFTDKIDVIRNFFEDIYKEELKDVLEALQDLISYHDGSPEDIFEELSGMYDALFWIYNQK